MDIRLNKKLITVFIADDHPLIRFGLRLSLEQVEGIRAIGEAIDGYSAVKMISESLPDVALIDVDMPGLSGKGAIRTLRVFIPHIVIIALTTYHSDHYISELLEAGADCHVLKNVHSDELVRIIFTYFPDLPFFSPGLLPRSPFSCPM